MAISFPSSPIVGQSYTVGSITWIWNGSSWDASNAISVPASYAKYTRSTTQTGAAANTVIVCNVQENSYGSDISVNTSTGQVTLTAGKTYRLRGGVPNFSGVTRPAFCWYNETSSAWIGESSDAYSPSDAATNGATGGSAECIITVAATTVVSFRVLSGSGLTLGGNTDFSTTGSYPWIDIQVIGAQAPIVGFTTTGNISANNIITGNNLIINGNAVGYGSITPVTGSNASPVTGNISATTSGTATTVLTLAIPSAGTWQITATVAAGLNVGQECVFGLYDGSGTLVTNSETKVNYIAGVTFQSSTTGVFIVTTNGAVNYTIRAWGPGSTAGCQIMNGNDGRTAATWTLLSPSVTLNGMTVPSNISVTGNVYANNFQGTQPNVTLIAGSYTYTLDNTGNFNMPANSDIVFSSNTTITTVASTNGNITISPDGTGQLVLPANTKASFGNTLSVVGTVTSNGATNTTGFIVGNGAVGNCAVAFVPASGTAANMAFRDYSTPNSVMYFDTTIGSANTGGIFQFRGSNAFTTYATINQYGVTQPTRPAFRVHGAGTTTNLTTTTNTNGLLNGNNFAADFNQGSYLNTTTGYFTAPVAGLYQVNLVCRCASNTGTAAQVIVRKNGQSGTTVVMVEWAANTTANHVGGASVVQLAVNDTLSFWVTQGNVNFDGNDNWSVAFIG